MADKLILKGEYNMAGKIHFTSGKTLDITDIEYNNISPVLNGKGIKTKRLSSGHIVPMNSMTMEFIEWIPEVEVEEPRGTIDSVDQLVVAVKEVSTKKTADDIIEEMTAKSNCKHEPEKMELYIQHTAKGIRYFPVCSFCGKRDRYVSESKVIAGEYVGTPNEKWTEKDITHAKAWIED